MRHSQALSSALARGMTAARENLMPALFLQAVMALVVGSYFLSPRYASLLYKLSDWKEQGGLYFSFVATGFSAGLFAEFCKVMFIQRGAWKLGNIEDGFFNFLMLGFSGAVVHVFYDVQAIVFGDHLAWSVILKKTTVDMLLFTPWWATPYQSIFLYWKNRRYSWLAVSHALREDFWTRHYLPVLIMEWIFWIPIVMMTYSLPLVLQFPFFLIAMTMWGLLVTALARSGVKPRQQATVCTGQTP